MNTQRAIRTNARNNQKTITDFLQNHYLVREHGKAKSRPIPPICLFCGETSNLTAEHVLPRWVFERDANRTFNIMINGLSHRYSRTTVQACRVCNNNLLSALEKRMLQLFSARQQHQHFFSDEEREEIIRWLEIIDYKYQVYSLVTRFKASKGKGQIEFLSDFPLSVLDPNIQYSPQKVMANLRESLRRITVKSKEQKLNSLLMFRTKNANMHFFHKNNEFLFLELPKYQLALLHFYVQDFTDELKAKDAAMEIIKQHY